MGFKEIVKQEQERLRNDEVVHRILDELSRIKIISWPQYFLAIPGKRIMPYYDPMYFRMEQHLMMELLDHYRRYYPMLVLTDPAYNPEHAKSESLFTIGNKPEKTYEQYVVMTDENEMVFGVYYGRGEWENKSTGKKIKVKAWMPAPVYKDPNELIHLEPEDIPPFVPKELANSGKRLLILTSGIGLTVPNWVTLLKDHIDKEELPEDYPLSEYLRTVLFPRSYEGFTPEDVDIVQGTYESNHFLICSEKEL